MSATDTTSGYSRTLTYGWNADGARTSVTYPDTSYVSFTYDGLDRMQSMLENGATTLASFAYDAEGRRTVLSRGGGVAVTGTSYDPAGRLATLTDDLAGTGSDLTSTFAYNVAGQIVSSVRSNDGYVWQGAYDVVRPYAVNGLNQYTSAGPAAFLYDPNGNLTSDGSTTFAYDAENRLVSASHI